MANIVLVGFMCTGKTQVGERLASALGMRFIDSDKLIEERAGKTIDCIFAEDGEEQFRRLEREVIEQLANKKGVVLATGGGVLGDKRNLADLKRTGMLVCLTAEVETLLARAERGTRRPLLDVPDPRARVEELLALRAPQYAQADYHIDTTKLRPDEVAAIIAGLLSVVPVELGDRSYEIVIDRGLLANASKYIDNIGDYKQIIVISEQRVWEQHGKELAAGLPRHKQIILPALEDAERLKSLRYADQLYDELLKLGCQRDALLVAFGGGTVGDLTGFVAATYMRGVDYIQIPTTLLAQVDSSVGGKVAVNHLQAKNLIGAFWQPRLVLADLHCLDTLPRRELRNGLAEIIKHAVLADARLFRYLEEHVEEVTRLATATMRHIIWRNCQIKAAIVSQDERESGVRAYLNLGHTFGHAIESAANYHGISHGEGVSIGMAAAGRLAQKLGHFPAESLDKVLALLRAFHLPTTVPQEIELSEALAAMKADKKALGGKLRFILPEQIGKVRVVSDVPGPAVRGALATGRSARK